MTPLEAAYPAFMDEELPRAEAIVVLGGAINGESRFETAQTERNGRIHSKNDWNWRLGIDFRKWGH